jgi:mono/diheme cytochrome c family protein
MKGIIHQFGLALVLLFVSAEAGHALDGEQQRIRGVLEGLCARCHAVTETGHSPLAEAPPFRTFSDGKLYDEDFGQRLQKGLTSIHPDMPTFHFDRRDAEAVVSYLRAIQEHKK